MLALTVSILNALVAVSASRSSVKYELAGNKTRQRNDALTAVVFAVLAILTARYL